MMTQSINLLINEEKALLENISDMQSFFQNNGFEKFELSTEIVNKLINLQGRIVSSDISLLEAYALLRYILETLIQTELLIKEEKYTFQVYYSIYDTQVKKCEKAIERIKYEIDIMKNFHNKDNEITKEYMNEFIKKNNEMGVITDEVIKQITRNKDDKLKILDKQADIEFTIFTNDDNGHDYKFNGYGFTAHLMSKQTLVKYEKQLKQLKKTREEIIQHILSNEIICQHFDFRNQPTKVFKELINAKSWKAKAEETNLQREYDFVYDLSSSVVHSVSYSYFTDNEIEKKEFSMVKNLVYKYSIKIVQNIKIYLDLDKVKIIKLV